MQKMSMQNMEPGQRLKAIIKKKGLKQKDIAADLGLSKNAITNYINGRLPRTDKLQQLADYLGVTTDFLLTGRESSTPWGELGAHPRPHLIATSLTRYGQTPLHKDAMRLLIDLNEEERQDVHHLAISLILRKLEEKDVESLFMTMDYDELIHILNYMEYTKQKSE